MSQFFIELREFTKVLLTYLSRRAAVRFASFEKAKDFLVDTLYQKRGKYARPFVHTGMIGLAFIGVTLGPMLLSGQAQAEELSTGTLPQAVVLGVSTDPALMAELSTSSSQGVIEYRGGEVIEYAVADGDTLGTIAAKFNLKLTTLLWANDLTEKSSIKPGQTLKVPPIDGVVHTVHKGDTVYSIAKKYGLGDDDAAAQAIINYPFNTFTNDETFELAIGQTIMVPDGVVPEEVPVQQRPAFARILTPDAGTVAPSGIFIWPAAGVISQGFRFYHKAIDISNKGGGTVLAADSGQVVVAGWPDNYGYGNRVMIDHGNGFVTLYAHMARIDVVANQTVKRGDSIGLMGSTGRSTGTHLHFEIRKNGVLLPPLDFLQ